MSCELRQHLQLVVPSLCAGQWCPIILGVQGKEGPQSCYQENWFSRFQSFSELRVYLCIFCNHREGEMRASLLHWDRTSVLLVKWLPRLLSATLCACNFHYAFRLSSFSIFSFIVFSYDQGSNRRAILGSESTDKICRPRHQWGLLSHTSYFSSQKCARGLT